MTGGHRDFASDQFTYNRRFGAHVLGGCTRKCLAFVPYRSLSGPRLAQRLEVIVQAEKRLRVDDGAPRSGNISESRLHQRREGFLWVSS